MSTETEVTPREETGFVCPDWARAFWEPHQCTIELCTDGNYAVACHTTHETIFVGTEEECADFLGGHHDDGDMNDDLDEE